MESVQTREPWNKGKLVGQKAPLKLKDIWAIRIHLQLDQRIRELALFNLAVDSKLRGCDLVNRRTRAPVILLTGTELFTPHDLQESWKSKGGKRAALIEPGHVDISHLPTLADLTQQVYLEMPSYHEWSEARWKRRVERRQKRVKQNA